ncbi:MAG: hypothetical protein GY940_44110 [bacterium]|nr:hypothetical protein [bacterium]
MENITGSPVTAEDFLKTRLFLVDELRELLRKHSVNIEAPRRFGKTSIIKELIRQEDNKKKKDREFNILFFELEGEETVDQFCLKLFKGLIELYSLRKRINSIARVLGDAWNILASRLKKIKAPELELEIREKTRDYDFTTWKEKITPLINGLSFFDQATIIVFDEFPDMLMNFKSKGGDTPGFKEAVDSLTAWLRSLRQSQTRGFKCQFVFCGSIHLRKTMEDLGIGKRINDLEPMPVPPINSEDAALLIQMLSEKYKLEIETDAMEYMVTKITDGSLYYGQILVKSLRDTGDKKFTSDKVKAIYEAMLRRGDHDLNHFHSRLEDYLSHAEKECSEVILKHLCAGAIHEKELYDMFLHEACSYELFQTVVNRLVYEGYVVRDVRDSGKLRFVAPILKDWWGFKKGINNVRL